VAAKRPRRRRTDGTAAVGREFVATERTYVQVAAMAARGLRLEDIARRLEIGTTTFKRLKERDPRVLEAYETGSSELHEELVGLLIKKAKKGETAALLFALKTRFSYRESGPTVDHHHTHAVRIELPAPLTREAYARKVDAARMIDATATPAP
jgi:hypothetical protein